MIPRSIKAADLFCGAGGTSQGVIEACDELKYDLRLKCFNHWLTAVETSRANHPNADVFCAELDSVNPRNYYSQGELDLLWASPECIEHSQAKSNKPISEQSRATAFCVTRWAEALRPSIILVENVRGFLNWGPIGSNGRPIKARRGEIFHSWVKCLEAIGYRVDWRILCAADYGDPTTRERLFVYAVRGRRKIVWPEPSHGELVLPDMFVQRQRWLSAREHVVDWSIPGKSIFKPDGSLRHCENTIQRIIGGLMQQGAAAEPFLLLLRGTSEAHILSSSRSIDAPAPAVLANGNHIMLCQPFVIGQQSGAVARSVDLPVPAVACAGAIRIVQPILIKYYGSETGGDSIDKPLATVTCRDRFMLVDPKLEPGIRLDIHTRMLRPHELAAAQGFPKTYQFTGKNKDIVKQIGNAVPKNLAKALVRAALTQSSS